MRRMIAVLAAALMLAAATMAWAPGAAGAAVAIAPSATTYVGKVQGTDAFVAVVVSGGEARAYVCDGAAISAWFAGRAPKGAFAASSESTSLKLTIGTRRVVGSLTLPDGTVHAASADRVGRTGSAGLYRGQTTIADKTYVGGWIVLPSGQVRGLVEQDSLVVPFSPAGTGIIAILIGRRAVELPGVGTLSITDGTSNTRR